MRDGSDGGLRGGIVNPVTCVGTATPETATSPGHSTGSLSVDDLSVLQLTFSTRRSMEANRTLPVPGPAPGAPNRGPVGARVVVIVLVVSFAAYAVRAGQDAAAAVAAAAGLGYAAVEASRRFQLA